MTVKILNTLHDRAFDGETIFYDIYTDEEKSADPDKEETGLFFCKGERGAKFAICNACGAMQDSFSNALIISEAGYNAFVPIYCFGAQTAWRIFRER